MNRARVSFRIKISIFDYFRAENPATAYQMTLTLS